MFDEDFDPKTKKPAVKPLDNMSVEELQDYLERLHQEIERVQAEIAKKENYKSAADAFFKK